ncbi:endonuclease/exonuclease/phosphatase family protein [Nonomuraea turkmeniaca]|uniref:endonuclease/exonuclease/phosphatase family protein n=1 Tax=Nonomuraea turkmeniaca TaxID=103838 RepID=UPI001B886BD0|nr:endonuclease/exonuclease/phosphatase family protein [Nonomuraea turkmeniaca]
MTATFDVWHWNVAGNKMHHGSTTNGMVARAVASILEDDRDLVAFNELCWGQYKAIQSALGSAGWPDDSTNYSRFATILGPTSGVCNGSEDFGNAIFSKQPLGPASRFTLPPDGTREQRNLLCAGLLTTPGARFCTTHITTSNVIADNGQKHNVNQLNFVLDQMEAYRAAGETVIIAGDFNAQPDYGRLNNWYSSSLSTAHNGNNTGHYRELDDNDPAQCLGYGEWTATGTPGDAPPCANAEPHAKIDLIFVRDDRIAGPYYGDSRPIPTACTGIPATPAYPAGSCSDHRMMTGTVPVLIG